MFNIGKNVIYPCADQKIDKANLQEIRRLFPEQETGQD